MRARHRNTPSPLRMALFSQADTPGQISLPNAVVEVGTILELATGYRISISTLGGSDATVQNVLTSMESSSWFHIACHGSQIYDTPMNSALLLRDGDLRLSTISTTRLPQAVFAFLSACHSAGGADPARPNEAMHLAAGFQFAGYGSVIGTMWALDDSVGPAVARRVYEHLFRSGGETTSSSDAAEALHLSIKVLRDSGASLSQWVPFIHMGV
jgi:CHAT domain-containing protein